MDTECFALSKELDGLDLIDYTYSTDALPTEDTTLRAAISIYNYEEGMQIDFDRLFETVFNEIDVDTFKELGINEVEIIVYEFIPYEDEDGSTGHGIAEKVFQL